MYLIKLYRGEAYANAYYESEALAREGFEQVKSCLGNPLIDFKFSMVFDGQEVGRLAFRLGEFDRAELHILTVTDEVILDTAKKEK